MSWDDFYVLDDFLGGFFADDGIELCEGGCGFPRSFCNCAAPKPIGNG